MGEWKRFISDDKRNREVLPENTSLPNIANLNNSADIRKVYKRARVALHTDTISRSKSTVLKKETARVAFIELEEAFTKFSERL